MAFRPRPETAHGHVDAEPDGGGDDGGGGGLDGAAPAIDPATIEDYVARFNAAEAAAGFLPSPTLGRFLAVLELRDALRRNRRRQAENARFLTAPPQHQSQPAVPRRGKLKRSVVERLLRKGHLLRQHAMAADDVEALFALLSRGHFASAGRREKVDESRDIRDVFDRMSEPERRRLRDVYWPWLDWLGQEPLDIRFGDGVRKHYANPLPLVIDIVVDNCGMREAEQRHGLRHGAARAILRAALHRYCLLAGYLHLPEAEASGISERRRSP
mgnify:CR=1 FL=1